MTTILGYVMHADPLPQLAPIYPDGLSHDGPGPHRWPSGVVAVVKPCENDPKHCMVLGCTGLVVVGYVWADPDDGALTPAVPPPTAPALGEPADPDWPQLEVTP